MPYETKWSARLWDDIPSRLESKQITFAGNLAVALARGRPVGIARKLGTTRDCVSYVICAARRRGVDVPGFLGGPARGIGATDTSIIQMAKSGGDVRDIAAAVGATNGAISGILSAARKLGVDIPRQRHAAARPTTKPQS